jgi:inositol oxygenase
MDMWKKYVLLLMALMGYGGALSASHKIQLVLTVPRTVSTAFERSMMARNDHKVFHEPWNISWMYRTGSSYTMVANPPQEILDAKTYEDVKALIYRYAENRPVFLKDMIHGFAEDLLNDEALLSDPNVVITLLIRDPARCIESFFNKGCDSIPIEFMSMITRMVFRYDLLMQIAEKHYALRGTWPILIESEELCQNPEDTLRSFCEQAGISFLPEALNWEQGVPDEWKHSIDWHQDAAMSRSFSIPKRDTQEKRFSAVPSSYVDTLEEIYQNQKPFYDQLKAMIRASAYPLPGKEEDQYRVYNESSPEHVKNFYKENHAKQTLYYVLKKKSEYLPLRKKKMDIWEAVDFFDQLVDESDPDMDLPQRYHLFQTAEALRNDGHPRWLILTGFIHDLGKILSLYGEPQWAVVGDTFPVGCAHSDKIVFPDYFKDNPDQLVYRYQTPCGIYTPGCGWSNMHLSWGHDEYLYHVVKNHLPLEASYIIRFHSFYAAHREGAYDHLMNEQDKKMLPWLKLFSRYDLYSKSSEKLDLDALLPYYRELVSEFFPDPLQW